jgi:hypothetical protein
MRGKPMGSGLVNLYSIIDMPVYGGRGEGCSADHDLKVLSSEMDQAESRLIR